MKKKKYTRIAIILVMEILFITPVMADNTALSFTAANEDYVDCGSDPELQMGTHDLTVEFWFKTSASGVQRIVGNGGHTDSDDGYSIWILVNGKLRAGLSDGTTSDGKQTNTVVNNGDWHHCAVVYDRDDRLWVCVDGTCVAKLMEVVTNEHNCDNTNSNFLMGRTTTSNSNNSFTGNLDEVRIWNTALDTATIFTWQDQELTSLHPNISNLQVYYKFNEGSGTTTNDLTADYTTDGYASNGTITGAQWVDSDIPGFTLGVGDEVSMPEVCALHQNYPNPFNPVTEITFALPTAVDIRLRVFNMVGQEVALIASGNYSAGLHTISFDGVDLPSGTYFYTLNDGSVTVTRQMILMK
jgi:hypothetical protein|tara:strand:- start:184 stop:1248 length:1065 start_codon:yes stop_codon:yes gene_type:complete